MFYKVCYLTGIHKKDNSHLAFERSPYDPDSSEDEDEVRTKDNKSSYASSIIKDIHNFKIDYI